MHNNNVIIIVAGGRKGCSLLLLFRRRLHTNTHRSTSTRRCRCHRHGHSFNPRSGCTLEEKNIRQMTTWKISTWVGLGSWHLYPVYPLPGKLLSSLHYSSLAGHADAGLEIIPARQSFKLRTGGWHRL
ncbi:uncharacterized protein HMPREF1120_00889 [Exophiala dermatitidis NIH/UT8656]|uniref:Uncharacterized protein n=1 Tax=Exophiala dermatitidis (strain ATCC 34100 / CBS 525.76 / NIH/UT8656) TaxID=858893 RepID=H6BKP6_EXODN|nr:uncharacterized protein HMPREF1120_00889 [Exophiala dermatitidis NIH/UT8656]EHY52680.1 hypothetical protein HMPREF1120_00889 [Exophiala dermatitidis NIH/UT8656]